MSAHSRLKAFWIRERIVFYRQIIPESSCARKEAVDIDILVTSRNVFLRRYVPLETSLHGIRWTFSLEMLKVMVHLQIISEIY